MPCRQDTDPAAVAAAANASGTGNHTVMLRVNGAAIAARGANMVPMEVLEGRIAPGQHRALVASAAAASFNTMREPMISPALVLYHSLS